jgi:hypothetical protein
LGFKGGDKHNSGAKSDTQNTDYLKKQEADRAVRQIITVVWRLSISLRDLVHIGSEFGKLLLIVDRYLTINN